MKALRFALRLLVRDWHSGELHLLVLALIVAVASVTTVGFFTNRVERMMTLQAAEILAPDQLITSSNPIPPQFSQRAKEKGLQTARTLNFPSVVVRGDQTQLVEVKGVSREYPLRGELRYRSALGQEDQLATTPPAAGTLWADARLLTSLGLDTDHQLTLGSQDFLIKQVLTRDSGGISALFRLGPRLLLALEDIPDTGLVTPASRVHHQLLIAGEREAIEHYTSWAEGQLSPGLTLEQVRNARPALRSALDRGDRFLGLAALVAVLIAGAAVALSTRRFVERQSDVSAILRCMGATSGYILQVLVIRLLLLGLLAALSGSLLGYGAQFLLAELVGKWFGGTLPPPDLAPLGLGISTGIITLIGFTLAPLLRLSSVPPLRVLRRDLGAPPPSFWLVGLLAFTAMGILMFWQAGDNKLASLVLAGSIAALGLLLLCARLLVALLTPLRQQSGTLWRYGLAGLARNPGLTAIQLTGFGLGILALLLITIIRIDLLAAWERTIPPKTPNLFLINIQPHEVEPLQAYLQQHDLAIKGVYPMLRARLTHINQQPIVPKSYKDERAQRLIAREFNLSWAEAMPNENRIVSGDWWQAGQLNEPLFSVEQGLAESLGIAMEDELRFDLAGIPINARVSNIRTVEWDSFQPNFFVIGTPGLLRDLPTTYITSFYLPPGKERTLAQLIRNFPAVTPIDVGGLMDHIRQIMARGSLAVECVFFFTLAAGLLVLYAGIQASRESRRQESAILRTLGLVRYKLLLAVGVEFITLGLLAGLLASLCAILTGWILAHELFGLDYYFNLWAVIVGTIGGGLGIGLAGVLATYPLVLQPPLHTLRSRA